MSELQMVTDSLDSENRPWLATRIGQVISESFSTQRMKVVQQTVIVSGPENDNLHASRILPFFRA